MLNLENYYIPLDRWIQTFVEWIAFNFRPAFLVIKWPIEGLLRLIQDGLLAMPPLLFLVVFTALAWWLAGRGLAIFTALSLVLLMLIGVWPESMTTLALIATAIVICVLIGIPTGILCARSDTAWRIVRPVLDVMQTTPSFVYLIPVVMLFGVGTVPGAVAVVVVAVPPLIRFTNLGIRMVDRELIEAGVAFGATERQLLWEVQLPQALPTILGGLNQTVLMAMVMAVIVAMIGAEGLGLVVLQGLGRLDVGRAAVGGIGIVLLAIILDRLTQAMANRERREEMSARPGLRAVLGGMFRGSRPALPEEAIEKTHGR
ncbi:proline/glycine betaine ABC transporter permease [Roseovarius spongiae]|uniref:Proline/glycine betaine ABC transporter permease n=1 Tax=Roseovarius spongiae TaxID=2320272 RepID=A0A3A8AQA4_9RHOB|nr:proline/glycine betaine ABC transporter permease [Roseovarius spongiae]RKF12577.1 proline/glycine betaine ABC transporter permease [Roseovarius spongiae]